MDTLDSLTFELNYSFLPNKNNIHYSSFKLSSDVFAKIADSNAVLDPLDGSIVLAKVTCENHKFLKSMRFEIKELYTTTFDAAYFTIPETYNRIQEND